MIYLLSTQALLDLLTGDSKMESWIKDKPAQGIEVSAVSIGQVLHLINKETDAAFRKELTGAFEKLLLGLRRYQGIIPLDESASKTWATLMSMTLMHGESKHVSPETRMVIASALTRNAILVDAVRPYHSQLPSLKIQSP
jgi:predicted nucleic acid-binding protein